MATIDEFKAQLIGGGPRANRFKIFIPRAGNRIEFLAKAGNIPAATLGVVEVQWRGSVLKLAGDRTFENWTVSIINDSEFSARSALEAWQTEIQELGGGNGATPQPGSPGNAGSATPSATDGNFTRRAFFQKTNNRNSSQGVGHGGEAPNPGTNEEDIAGSPGVLYFLSNEG